MPHYRPFISLLANVPAHVSLFLFFFFSTGLFAWVFAVVDFREIVQEEQGAAAV